MNAKETAEELARLRNLATVLYDENARFQALNAHLCARVAELEAEARWVSVEEGLPEVDASTPWTSVEVAVFDGTAVISPAFYYFSDGSPLFGYKAKDWRSGNETVQGVTHWRYITPPEASNE